MSWHVHSHTHAGECKREPGFTHEVRIKNFYLKKKDKQMSEWNSVSYQGPSTGGSFGSPCGKIPTCLPPHTHMNYCSAMHLLTSWLKIGDAVVCSSSLSAFSMMTPPTHTHIHTRPISLTPESWDASILIEGVNVRLSEEILGAKQTSCALGKDLFCLAYQCLVGVVDNFVANGRPCTPPKRREY